MQLINEFSNKTSLLLSVWDICDINLASLHHNHFVIIYQNSKLLDSKNNLPKCTQFLFQHPSQHTLLEINPVLISHHFLLIFARDSIYAVSAHMLSKFRPSLCPSVTRVIHAKTVVVRIVQFLPHSSPIPLVFAR